jgi:hypothetical protein
MSNSAQTFNGSNCLASIRHKNDEPIEELHSKEVGLHHPGSGRCTHEDVVCNFREGVL